MNFHLIIAALFCLSLGAVNGSLSKMRRTSKKYIRVGGRSQSESEFGRTIDPHEVEAEATAVFQEMRRLHMREMFGQVSGSMIMSLGGSMSLSTSMSMSMSFSMSMSYILPKEVPATMYPTSSLSESSLLPLDNATMGNPEISEITASMAPSGSPSSLITSVSSSSLTLGSVEKGDVVNSEIVTGLAESIKPAFSGDSPSSQSSSSAAGSGSGSGSDSDSESSSSSFSHGIMVPALVLLLLLCAMIMLVFVYRMNTNNETRRLM